jgi:hypothetical protein
VAKTREGGRQLAGVFPAADTIAFRALAAQQDKDVQQLLGEAVNMVFEHYDVANRVRVTSGRRGREQ